MVANSNSLARARSHSSSEIACPKRRSSVARAAFADPVGQISKSAAARLSLCEAMASPPVFCDWPSASRRPSQNTTIQSSGAMAAVARHRTNRSHSGIDGDVPHLHRQRELIFRTVFFGEIYLLCCQRVKIVPGGPCREDMPGGGCGAVGPTGGPAQGIAARLAGGFYPNPVLREQPPPGG